MADHKKKAKRRLLDIKVDEVSVVDNPAIDETFVLVKRTEKAESSMNLKIKEALEAKGMTLEQLAEAAKIDLEKLQAILEGTADPSEEELAAITGILDIDESGKEESKLGDEKDNTKQDDAEEGAKAAEDEAKQDEAMPPAEDAAAASVHKQLLDEKLDAIAKTATELKNAGSDMNMEEMQNRLRAMSNVIWSVHDTAEVAMLTKRADVAIDGAENAEDIAKAIDHLAEALAVVKASLVSDTDEGEKKDKVKKAADADGKADVTENPEYVKLKKKNDDLEKKVEGLEKSGISKSLTEDDATGDGVKKSDDACDWAFLGGDFKS